MPDIRYNFWKNLMDLEKTLKALILALKMPHLLNFGHNNNFH